MSAFSNDRQQAALERGLRARLVEVLGSRSQRELARRLGINSGTLSRHVTGKQLPRVDFLAKIALVTGTSLDWLVLGRHSRHVSLEERVPSGPLSRLDHEPAFSGSGPAPDRTV